MTTTTIEKCDYCKGKGCFGWVSEDGDFDFEFCHCNPLHLVLE